jgi:hypothetical protein
MKNKNKLHLSFLVIFSFLITMISLIIISYSQSNNIVLYYKLETNYIMDNLNLKLPEDTKLPENIENYQEDIKNIVDFYISENKIKINAIELSNNQIVTDTSIIIDDNSNKLNVSIIDNVQKVYSIIPQENIDTFLSSEKQMKEIINNSTIKKEGSEKVGNLVCEKYSVFYNNKKLIELYTINYKKLISPKDQENFKKLYLESNLLNKFNSFNDLGNKLSSKVSKENIPIKYSLFENDKLSSTTLLKEIKFIEYNKKYFEIPSNYKKIDFNKN